MRILSFPKPFLTSCAVTVLLDLKPATNGWPIAIREDERNLHAEEQENGGYVDELAGGFQAKGILSADAVVEPEDCAVAQRTGRELRDALLSLAGSDDRRAWMDKIWPFQDDAGDL
jgi:hypothetical protein